MSSDDYLYCKTYLQTTYAYYNSNNKLQPAFIVGIDKRLNFLIGFPYPNITGNFDQYWSSNYLSFFLPKGYNGKFINYDNDKYFTFVGPYLGISDNFPCWFLNDGTPTNIKILSSDVLVMQLTQNSDYVEQDQFIRDLCNNSLYNLFGLNNPMPNYQQGSDYCDSVMQAYCDKAENAGLDVCSCIRENQAFLDENLQVSVPTTCYGKLCGTTGYRTKHMANENCALSLCAISSDLNGTKIVNNTQTTVFCGGQFSHNKLEQISLLVTPTPINPITDIPFYVWILLTISIIVSAVLLYLIYIKLIIDSQKPK